MTKVVQLAFDALKRLGFSPSSPKTLTWLYKPIFDCVFCFSLKSLNLCHNQLKTVPAEIFMLRNLEYLSVSHNHIQSINPSHIALMFTPGKFNSIQFNLFVSISQVNTNA